MKKRLIATLAGAVMTIGLAVTSAATPAAATTVSPAAHFTPNPVQHE